ncbi:OLC1v1016633C1 [Oldenlandia corymbosa var. corymbosa]|uniref:Endoglucanase n=1 Tax=Oldenlandia corymbosa var. corymbosa TaxID=529605 RepID=A0AAV1E7L4_OLDCO|nr:OLC1v1016633C1 [Oldenlandia corymbosa var. corymbosa]
MQESKGSQQAYSELSRNYSSATATTVYYVHSIPGTGRLLPSSSRWNSIELDSNHLLPEASNGRLDSLPSRFTKIIDFNLTIRDKNHFKRFCYTCATMIIMIVVALLLVRFLQGQRQQHHGHLMDLKLAINQALLFFDAQKSGPLPENSKIKFRADSGLHDGTTSATQIDLVGGYYDCGNNMKFSFTTAYAVTLLSWSVIEYHEKYDNIQELEHVKDLIRWGSDYLLKIFSPPNASSPAKLYSQVGSPGNDTSGGNTRDNDISCWQRPENMSYERPVSTCDMNASDLAGEIIAGMSAAALVFKEDNEYSTKLVQAAEELFNLTTNLDPSQKPGMYTSNDDCGGRAREFYNSTSFRDELVWGATWLFFISGNSSYLDYAIANFGSAEEEEQSSEQEILNWNNKLAANAILLTRLRYFRDPGYPYEPTLISTTNRSDLLMCSYTSNLKFPKTEGGLVLLKPDYDAPLQYAVTASFLTKLYGDYLALLHVSHVSCAGSLLSLETLRDFSLSQVHYILGINPSKMSYLVGYGDRYPSQVHHRAASIPWDNKSYTCEQGDHWLYKDSSNPNLLQGAMVAGPDKNDNFFDKRADKRFTEPSISANAGLVAALVALLDTPSHFWNANGVNLGIDRTTMLENINTNPT